MTWVAVAVAGGAVLSAGASYAGSKKQSDASKRAANTQLGMFNTINAQQQPFIQSGYGAQARLNTLLGLGGRAPSAAPSTYRPMPGGGMRMQPASGPTGSAYPDLRLRQILQLRAMQGDQDAIGQLQAGE